jgi:FkbM family methyltransferase
VHFEHFRPFFVSLYSPTRAATLARLVWDRACLRKASVLRVDGIEFEQKFGLGNGTWAVAGGLDYDPELKEALSLLGPEDTVIDLGANVGVYALRFASVAKRVIAVEANPETARILRRNADRNGLNLEIELAAAADISGRNLDLVWFKGRPNMASIFYAPFFHGKTESVKVSTLAVDDLVDRLGISSLKLVKMDIEGSEADAIRGMKKTIARFRPIILFENSFFQAVDELEALGYKIGKKRGDAFYEGRKGMNLWAMPGY